MQEFAPKRGLREASIREREREGEYNMSLTRMPSIRTQFSMVQKRLVFVSVQLKGVQCREHFILTDI